MFDQVLKYKPKGHTLAGVISVLALLVGTGCPGLIMVDPEPEDEDQIDEDDEDADGETDSGADDTLVVTLHGEAALGGNATSHITLYGYDPGIADQAANLIVHVQKTVAELPAAIEVVLPADMHQLIDPGNPSADEARYYWGVNIDLNSDGEICDGEILQDFDAQEPIFGENDDLGDISIPVKVYEVLGCRSAAPEDA